jgi:subtilisin family serine protease
MIDGNTLDLSSEEVKSAERKVREQGGAEIDEKLDSLLEYRMTQEDDGGLESTREHTVIVHYKTTRSLDEIRQHYAQATESDSPNNLGDEIAFVEQLADEEAQSLTDALHEEGAEIQEHLRLANAIVTRLTARQIMDFAARPEVERIEADKTVSLELDQSTVTIGAVSARSQGLVGTGEGVIVAVIDGEVDKHPDLQGRVVHKRNYTSESWGNPHRHGTHVAGIIAGNGDRYQGVAPAAIIWSYKIYPSGQTESAEGFTAADAIEDAVKDGAKVVNCSWGVSQTPKNGTCVWCKTAERAATLGIVVVKSAGNSGRDGKGSLTCPACAKGDVIVVGASSHDGKEVMEFSSQGPTVREKPDVIAPGDQITAAKNGGGYRILSGTSMAAPHVAGMAALILQRHPTLKPSHLRKALMDSATPLDREQYDRNIQGTGLVDVVKVMQSTTNG